MAEAMRLTRAGRLAEATAVIQRTLGSAPPVNASAAGFGSEATSTKTKFRVVDDSPPSTEPSAGGMAHSHMRGGEAVAARLAAALSTLSPQTMRFPGSMPMTSVLMRPVTPEVMPSSTHAGGQFVDATYSSTVGTRAYKLYIPSGYTGQAVPLVVMLHGCTQRPVDFAAGTRMNVLAEGETFLVAYPEQAPAANGAKCWNWFQESDQQRDGGEPSLIAGITRQIMSQYQVDESRVYVAGMSAGGAMAVVMAATYPDLYAAVGVHSGLAYGAAHDLPSAFAAMQQGTVYYARHLREIIPLIAFHGDGDAMVAPANADSLLDQWLQAASDGLGSRPDVKVEQGQVADGHAYSRCIYHDADGRALMEQWTVHQASHAWSGGSPSGSYTDPQGPDASTEMVRFFREHPRSR
jgi:poly(hydroxyalkanoate) depolymerase family esterase